MSGNAIVEKRGLPPALANWYVSEAPAFEVLRGIRDAVIHRGVQLPTVLDVPDRGLAVGRDEHPWKEFAIWEGVQPVNGRLVPLRLGFAAIVNHILGASERLVEALTNCVRLPPAVGLGVRVYLRSDVTRRLIQIPEMLRQPWECAAALDARADMPRIDALELPEAWTRIRSSRTTTCGTAGCIKARAAGQEANSQVFKLSSAVTEETKRAFLRVIETDSLVVHYRDREGNPCSADLNLVRAALEAVDER